MIQKGADIHVKNNTGRTPLDLSIELGERGNEISSKFRWKLAENSQK